MSIIQKLNERLVSALKVEVSKRHPEDETLKAQLLEKIPTLHHLSVRHIDILNKFKLSNQGVEFPALHKELFSTEGQTGEAASS